MRRYGLSNNLSLADNRIRGRLLPSHEEQRLFQEAWDTARAARPVPRKHGLVGQTKVQLARRDRSDVQPRPRRQIRGHLRVHHSYNNTPRPGLDQDDHDEVSRSFPRSSFLRLRGRRPRVRQHAVRDEGGTLEGAQEHAHPDPHLEQDQRYVQADDRVRGPIRRLFVRAARKRARDGDEGTALEIRQRRDSQLRVRRLRRLDKRSKEHILRVREERDQRGRLEEEHVRVDPQEHALAGQAVRLEIPRETRAKVLLRPRLRDDRE